MKLGNLTSQLLFPISGDRKRAIGRLEVLNEIDEAREAELQPEAVDWETKESILSQFQDRLGQAGFISKRDRAWARFTTYAIFVSGLLGAAFIGLSYGGGKGFFIGLFVGLYVSALAWLFFIRNRKANYEREIVFQVPLVLESLILLVEAGLGILPAIERVVAVDKKKKRSNPVVRILALVYQLSAKGMPLSQALETVAEVSNIKVLRHVLLHLDISGTEGGELVPALRSLSHHAHTEWKLSVQQRVKKLENYVVFPVFVAVIGLMLLTAAVPLVSVLEMQDSLTSPNLTQTNVMGGSQ